MLRKILISYKVFLSNAIIAALLLMIFSSQVQAHTNSKKLISFGWDRPTVPYLLANLPVMEKQPFDGVTFSFSQSVPYAFDTELKNDEYFMYDDLKKLRWNTFTDNFILLWGVGRTGPHWFDNTAWLNIESNLKKLSLAVNVSKAKGILFDPEYYLGDNSINPWVYSKTLYPAKSFAQVSQQVRLRGAQFMRAMQYNKPNIKILSIWMLGLVLQRMETQSLENIDQALLPAFIQGMLEAKGKDAVIIDGNETSYWYSKASEFLEARSYLKSKGKDLLSTNVRDRYINNVPQAQAIFVDGLLATSKEFERGYTEEAKWTWLYNNLKFAMASSDEYVWFYGQEVTWWKGKPNEKINALIRRVKGDLNNLKTTHSAAALQHEFLRTDAIKYTGDHFLFDHTTNKISLFFNSAPPDKIIVYKNSRRIQTITGNRSKNVVIRFSNLSATRDNITVITENTNAFTPSERFVAVVY